jgi:hypothetical protein
MVKQVDYSEYRRILGLDLENIKLSIIDACTFLIPLPL